MTTTSHAGKLPKDYTPLGELTEAIHAAWRAVDARMSDSGERGTLGAFAAELGCQPQAVWVWLTAAKTPSPAMCKALVRVLPGIRPVLEERGLLDERRRANRGERGYALLGAGAQRSDEADKVSAMRRKEANRRAARADRIQRIKQRARALGMDRHT